MDINLETILDLGSLCNSNNGIIINEIKILDDNTNNYKISKFHLELVKIHFSS